MKSILSNAHVDTIGAVPELNVTNATFEALDVVKQSEAFDCHGRSLPCNECNKCDCVRLYAIRQTTVHPANTNLALCDSASIPFCRSRSKLYQMCWNTAVVGDGFATRRYLVAGYGDASSS